MHVNFGIDMINQIKLENPQLWDEAMQTEARNMILQGTQLKLSTLMTPCPWYFRDECREYV